MKESLGQFPLLPANCGRYGDVGVVVAKSHAYAPEELKSSDVSFPERLIILKFEGGDEHPVAERQGHHKKRGLSRMAVHVNQSVVTVYQSLSCRVFEENKLFLGRSW